MPKIADNIPLLMNTLIDTLHPKLYSFFFINFKLILNYLLTLKYLGKTFGLLGKTFGNLSKTFGRLGIACGILGGNFGQLRKTNAHLGVKSVLLG